MHAPPREAPLREAVYTPESPLRHPGRFIAAMLRDFAMSRGLAWRLFVRDLSAMYRQSFFGYLWAFVPPVLAALPWVFLNHQSIISIRDTPIAYPAFVLTGMLLWQSFLDALNSPLKQANTARSMLAKVNFPREALILAGLAEAVWNLGIRLLLLIPVLALYGALGSTSLIWAPFAMAGLLILGLSLGLLITPLGLLYTDVSRGITLIATFGMLLTPVVYPPRTTGLGGWLATWNPVSPVLVTARDWLTGQGATLSAGFWWVFAGAWLLFFVAAILYRLTMPLLIERMGE
jgi:lipopolysaccharide transport system permease protein